MLPIPELYILAHMAENEESVLQCYALTQGRGEAIPTFPVYTSKRLFLRLKLNNILPRVLLI